MFLGGNTQIIEILKNNFFKILELMYFKDTVNKQYQKLKKNKSKSINL